MMTCREARSQLFAERDDALGESQRASLSAHLAVCEDCRRIRQEVGTGLDTWRNAFEATSHPNPDLEWRRLQRAMQRPRRPTFSRRVAWIVVPAAAVAAVVVALQFESTPSSSEPNPPRVIASAEAAANAAPPAPSTVVFVDDKSGWTFVVSNDGGGQSS